MDRKTATIENINKEIADGKTPLLYATDTGTIKTLHFLKEAGVDLNISKEDGYTVLFLSIINNSINTFSFLLQAGPDVIQTNDLGCTALHHAA